MHRYLVVANLTLGGEHLLAALRQRVEQGPCSLHVVVPAGPDQQGWAHEESQDLAAAQRRLDAALERFRQLGCEVTGAIGDPRPVDAIRDALKEGDYEEVILSTLPAGASRWLGLDLVSRLERSIDTPLVHIEATGDIVR